MTTFVTDPITIASVGLNHIFVELLVRPLGETFELQADLVQYNAFTGHYLRDEVGRQTAKDADDAIEAASDIQWDAYKAPTNMNLIDSYKSPCGFGEAIEKLFNEGKAFHAIAAE